MSAYALFFLWDSIEKKTSIFAIIQHATDPVEQSSRQFVSLFSTVVYRCLHSSFRTTCVQLSAALLSNGTAKASGWLVLLCKVLLKATEKEASSENYRTLPGYYLWYPGTAKQAETMLMLSDAYAKEKKSLTQLYKQMYSHIK